MSAGNWYVKVTEFSPRTITTAPPSQQEQNRQIADAINGLIAYGFEEVGTFRYYKDGATPTRQGWLLCDGSTITREKFPQYFAKFVSDPATTEIALDDLRSLPATGTADPAPVTVDDGGAINVGNTPPPPLPDAGQTGGSGATIPSGGRPKVPYNIDYFTWF